MNILVASAYSADSRFAHAINTIKMADGFAKLGHQVIVLCRRPAAGPVPIRQLQEDFGIEHCIDFVQLRPRFLGRALNPHSHFGFQVLLQALGMKPDLAYCRNYVAPAWLSRLGINVAAESHAHPGNRSAPLRTMVAAAARNKTFRKIVTIAPVLRDHFVELGVPAEKVQVLPDAVDLDMFQRPEGYCRTSNASRPRIVYAGHLYDYKGIPTILEAAALVPDYDFVLIGGTEKDSARQAVRAEELGLGNVEFLGLLPHSAVPAQLWEADLLLLPPSAQHPSAKWTSPVKLGEYLASGTPVVATRIPALEYWLAEDEVVFVEPDDPASLVRGIETLLRDAEKTQSVADAGLRAAQKLSYQERCQRIIEASCPNAV
ncbi:glycosyltransferase family 4 protein [Pelagibius litoralis]|uniref:Glycosyltransferase family 4 protein n=1 Tax=Pelagibius litoralis TaxID=374515 RepID=A0A967C5S7_9PROT|nr:glycosyltransferase [Pelagibius litoralis]NIA69075.1 glycosyltransferase family 4 protein [Pelagibius litoralis]